MINVIKLFEYLLILKEVERTSDLMPNGKRLAASQQRVLNKLREIPTGVSIYHFAAGLRLSDIVFRLRNLGYDIKTVRLDACNEDNRICKYVLVGEPKR